MYVYSRKIKDNLRMGFDLGFIVTTLLILSNFNIRNIGLILSVGMIFVVLINKK